MPESLVGKKFSWAKLRRNGELRSGMEERGKVNLQAIKKTAEPQKYRGQKRLAQPRVVFHVGLVNYNQCREFCSKRQEEHSQMDLKRNYDLTSNQFSRG